MRRPGCTAGCGGVFRAGRSKRAASALCGDVAALQGAAQDPLLVALDQQGGVRRHRRRGAVRAVPVGERAVRFVRAGEDLVRTVRSEDASLMTR